jgi:hypothetical protein
VSFIEPRLDREAACHPDFQAYFGNWIPAFTGMTSQTGLFGQTPLKRLLPVSIALFHCKNHFLLKDPEQIAIDYKSAP